MPIGWPRCARRCCRSPKRQSNRCACWPRWRRSKPRWRNFSMRRLASELSQPLDFASDRECGVGNLVADMLRERMGAEVGLVAIGQAFDGPLPGGPLKRMTLWEVCASPANPGAVTLTGAQLQALVARGVDPAFAA